MRGILRLEMLSVSGGEKNREGEEEERITGDGEKKRERCCDQSETEQIISGLVSRRKLP